MRIAYVFTRGRRSRLERRDAGESAPTEFALGAPEVRAAGHEVDVFELPDFAPRGGERPGRAVRREAAALRGTGLTSSAPLLSEASVRCLGGYDVVLAGNEYVALGLDAWARVGAFSAPRCFWVMGMFSKLARAEARGWRGRRRRARGFARYGELAGAAERVFFVGRPEMELFQRHFPAHADKCLFTPFPVDTDFWCPAASPGAGEDLLFVGNDAHRDVELLLATARAMPARRFRCVTKLLEGRPLPPNVEVLGSDWYGQAISDTEMRELYRGCGLLVLPIGDTHQPSGQSVAQQAMACGRPVALSRFPGLWLDELEDGEQLRLVDRPEPEAWRDAIAQTLGDPEAAAAMGRRGRDFVAAHLRTERFARMLLDALEDARA